MNKWKWDHPWPFSDPRLLLVMGFAIGMWFTTMWITANQSANGAWMPKLREDNII